MSSEIEKKKEEIIKQYGQWTAHNINIGEDIYTINEKLNYDTLKLRRVIQIISDISDERFSSLRVLDLGSLEGLYTIELGLQGIEHVVGIEVRKANFIKAEFSKESLRINNVQFFQDDVRNLSEDKYGRFELILCLGLLYHLDTPDLFNLLEKIYNICNRFIIIDTRITSKNNIKVSYQGQTYFGTYVREFKKGLSEEKKAKFLWRAIDNEKSFLFSKESLLKILNNIGFTSVYECHIPFEHIKPKERLTLLAVKGKKVMLNTYPPINVLSEGYINKIIS